MSAPVFRIRGADLGYPGHTVLRAVELSVAAGDFVVIGGPNGGGKSTLLRALAGLLPPLRGGVDAGSTRFGYVPQQAAIDHALPFTALEMVALGASARKPWWRTIITPGHRAESAALTACQAGEFGRMPFARLSGGQRQRVLLARALASQPDCFLLDEPTAGVDRRTQCALADLLSSLRRKDGRAVVLITHEFAPFQSSASRFLWVQDAEVQEIALSDFVGRQGAFENLPVT